MIHLATKKLINTKLYISWKLIPKQVKETLRRSLGSIEHSVGDGEEKDKRAQNSKK